MTVAEVAEPLEVRSPRTALSALWVTGRPRQWVKNLVLLAGIVFAAELDDPGRLLRAALIVGAYCLASSAAYLLNDVRDAPADRLHPSKRSRPVAAGALTPRDALATALVAAAVALGLAAAVGPWSLALLVGFAGLQLVYSLGLKHVAFVDVGVIASLFVVRAVAGAVAVDVRISPWLVACSGLLALFLALAKRRAELASRTADGGPGRPVLRSYSVAALDRLLAVTAFASAGVYLAYALTAHETRTLVVTVPFVAYGLWRYLTLVRRGAGEEPERIMLKDARILVTVVVWVAVCAAVLAAAR